MRVNPTPPHYVPWGNGAIGRPHTKGVRCRATHQGNAGTATDKRARSTVRGARAWPTTIWPRERR